MGNISGEVINTSLITFLEDLSLDKIFSISRHHGFGCALYRLPNSNVKHLIIDRSGGRDLDHLHLDEMGKGFVFHPFSSDRHPIKFLNEDIHFTENIETEILDLEYSRATPDELMDLFDNKKKYTSAYSKSIGNGQLKTEQINNQKSEFIGLINKTIHGIKEEKFQKVVIARNKTIELQDQFSSFDFFDSLSDHYRNAFVYMTFIPEVGSWMGATPETLINIDCNRQFQTVALAATQAYRNDMDLEDTTWSQKDIEEQAMVSRYIINCFKKIRLREFEEIGPRTHLSGNLVHLKTNYIVDMDQVAFPQ
jgi:isochorismate synthase